LKVVVESVETTERFLGQWTWSHEGSPVTRAACQPVHSGSAPACFFTQWPTRQCV